MAKGDGLKAAIAQIKKVYGPESIMKFSDAPAEVDAIPLGCLSFDIASGIGGVPRGRICEVFGPEGGGKTTLALHLVANVQKAGGNVAYIDVENALNIEYAAKLGINLDDVHLSQPDNGEEGLTIAETLIRSGEIDLVVIDSVDALLPEEVLQGEMEDRHVSPLARLMSQALRKLTAVVKRSKACLLFINQLRSKIPTGKFSGPPGEVTSGGRALRYYASMRIEIKSIEQIKDNADYQIGKRTQCHFVKNKVAVPFKKAEFDLIFGEGISFDGDLLDEALERHKIERSGAWFSWDGTKLGQGRDAAIKWLKEHPDDAASLRAEIMEDERKKWKKERETEE